MKKINCPNCGAPFEIEAHRCPYCGTSYFDMGCIDFENGEPFYLKIKYGNIYITQLVRPSLESFELKNENVDIYGGINNNKLYSYTTSSQLETNIKFNAVQSKGALCIIERV